jgi:hypothetical protein
MIPRLPPPQSKRSELFGELTLQNLLYTQLSFLSIQTETPDMASATRSTTPPHSPREYTNQIRIPRDNASDLTVSLIYVVLLVPCGRASSP